MTRLIPFLALMSLLGCSEKPESPAKGAPNPGPRHWDVGDATFSHPLPPEISDGYLEFSKSSAMSFGVTMAHERISERRHQNSDLLLYIHSGVARVRIGEKEFTVSTGDAIFIPKGAAYSADAVSRRELELFTIYAPPLEADDVEYLEAAERAPVDTLNKRRLITKTSLAPDSLRTDSLSLEQEFMLMQDYRELEEIESEDK